MAENSKIKRDILSRVNILYTLFLIAGIVLLLRIFYVQLFSVEVATNSEKIYGRIFHSQGIRAHRGSILSRDGVPLATSILRYQVEMDFGSQGFDSLKVFHRQADSLSKLLAAYFKDKPVQAYRDMFRSNRQKHYQLKFVKDTLIRRSDGWIANLIDKIRGEEFRNVKLYDTIRSHRPVKILPREIDYSEWQVLRKYPILNWNMGMTYNLSDRDERVYTQSGLAKRTIGEIKDDRGNDYGLEAVYNDVLEGQDGEVLTQRIARGFYGRVVGAESRDAVDGDDILTTIDLELQDLASRALREQVEAQESAWGTTIIMEVATGDILAIANLDRLADGHYSEQINRAIGARAEPGSTFKLAASMALLEQKDFTVNTTHDSGDGKRIVVGKAKVQDSHKGYSDVSIRTAFEQSLNGFFAKAVYEEFKDRPTDYTDFLKSLKLHEPTGLEAFGEAVPRLPEKGSSIWWDHITLVNMAYGYGVELTPMQTLTLYNSVANNGKMMRPRLVREVQRDGETIKSFPTEVRIEKVASQSTIDTLRSYLENVCENGTANYYLGRFDGFKAGAKTGTAQFAQDGKQYRDRYYLGSLVGYLPADKPKYSIITVILKRPGKGTTIYGGGLAGPVMKKIMQGIYNREHSWHTRLDTMTQRDYPRTIKDGDIESIRIVSEELTPYKISSREKSGWGELSLGDSVENRVQISPLDLNSQTMPNVKGMGLRDALFLLENIGLKVTVMGSGAIYKQSIAKGRTVKSGEGVTIQLK